MATIPAQTHTLLSVPFSVTTDFTILADHCEKFAETLIENDNPVLKMSLCARLSACLTLLQPTLNDPVPPHLLESLAIDTLPPLKPAFDPDSELLCDYCLTLAKLLSGQVLVPETEKTLTGLLCELVWFFAADTKKPRWIRTSEGVMPVEEVMEAL